MTTPTQGEHAQTALPTITRYKIGYPTGSWGERSSTPSGIPDFAGTWVRYADHAAELRRLHAQVAALTAAQPAAPQGVAYAEPAEFPAGAIVNGRTHIDRLESFYRFDCEAGPLINCDDWHGLKRCFEHLAELASNGQAPAAGAVAGPTVFGLQWPDDERINLSTIFDTEHEANEFILERCRTPGIRVVRLSEHTTPAAPADSVLEDAADPLQGAANWLAEAHGQFSPVVLSGCLMIGYNRAKRLHDAAIAARKQGAKHDNH